MKPLNAIGPLVPGVGRARPRAQGADIWLCGAAALATTLVDEADELVLKVNPIVLDGIGLFAGDIGPRTLEVTAHRRYPNGFALVRGRFGGLAQRSSAPGAAFSRATRSPCEGRGAR